MEYALEDTKQNEEEWKQGCVLILVLMEYALEVNYGNNISKPRS